MYVAWAPFFSGAERALLVLLDRLDRSRYRPVAAIGTDAELAAEIRARDVSVVHIPVVYPGFRTAVGWVGGLARLGALALRERVALVHSNDVPSFPPVGTVARRLGLPAVTHIRFPESAAGYRWFLRAGFVRAIFVSASAHAEGIADAPDVFDGRSEVIYDGVHVPPEPSDAERNSLRRELGLPLERTLVVMAGQVAEIKGIWDYIEAATLLSARGVRASFVVLGDDLRNNGRLRREAEAAVRARGLTETVTFLGFRPKAQRLMPAFDIVAAPSHVEPLGLSVLEGMAAARPVVGSNVGGIAETMVDGVTGFLVPPQHPARLAEALEVLVSNPVGAKALGRAGRQRVLDRFSVDAHAIGIQSMYQRCLGTERTDA